MTPERYTRRAQSTRPGRMAFHTRGLHSPVSTRTRPALCSCRGPSSRVGSSLARSQRPRSPRSTRTCAGHTGQPRRTFAARARRLPSSRRHNTWARSGSSPRRCRIRRVGKSNWRGRRASRKSSRTIREGSGTRRRCTGRGHRRGSRRYSQHQTNPNGTRTRLALCRRHGSRMQAGAPAEAAQRSAAARAATAAAPSARTRAAWQWSPAAPSARASSRRNGPHHQQSRSHGCPCGCRTGDEGPLRCRRCGAWPAAQPEAPPPLGRRGWRSRHRSSQHRTRTHAGSARLGTRRAPSSRQGTPAARSGHHSIQAHTHTWKG